MKSRKKRSQRPNALITMPYSIVSLILDYRMAYPMLIRLDNKSPKEKSTILLESSAGNRPRQKPEDKK